jgi:phage terminase large subunit GpA-like protein
MSDPMGKRALFSVADPPRAAAAAATGTISKEALFSASGDARRFGTVVVDCSTCGARSRLGWTEFAWRHLPFWLWVPWLRYSRYMACPACDRRTWLSVSWLT